MTEFLDIPHPTNRVWPGTPNSVMPSIEEAYQDGIITGVTWPDHWKHIPGGPWVHGREFRNNQLYLIALCDHSANVHKEWIRGWHKGFVEYRLETKLPSWYRPLNDF